MTYRSPEKMRFCQQRARAKVRGVEFLLTFEEWLDIWTKSGKLAERGKKRGQYNMGRIGDVGPYAVGNVKILRHETNATEGSIGHTLSASGREKVAASKRGKKLDSEWRANLSAAKMGNRSRLGTPHSAQDRQAMSEAQQRRRERERMSAMG